jgi:hypothetical protein
VSGTSDMGWKDFEKDEAEAAPVDESTVSDTDRF